MKKKGFVADNFLKEHKITQDEKFDITRPSEYEEPARRKENDITEVISISFEIPLDDPSLITVRDFSRLSDP